MNLELVVTFTILVITIILFIWDKIRSDLVALLSLMALLLSGVITTGEALSGFSNSVVVMIAGLFVVGAGIFRTGLAESAGKLVIQWSGGSQLRLLILLMLVVAVLSAFMSNTGTVAMLMPVVISVAMKMKASPSKFLMPLAYASSLGGVLTLIGTPPNLIVSQALVDYGYEPLGFFDFTPVGIVALVTGILFLVLFGKYLIPNHNIRTNGNSSYSPSKLMKLYELSDKLCRIEIESNSPFVGKKLKELKLPSKYGIYVLFIERAEQDSTPFRQRTQKLCCRANTNICASDILFVEGDKDRLEELAKEVDGVKLLPPEVKEHDSLITEDLGIAEVLFTPHSRFLNRKIKELQLTEKYGLNIMGMNRKGRCFFQAWADEKIEFGDAILVQGQWSKIELLAEESQDVVVVGKTSEEASQAKANGKAPIAASIMLLMLILMTFEIVPAVTAVLIAAIGMVLTGCLRNMDDAYSRVNWQSVILFGAMLPMAIALENTGGVLYLSDMFVSTLGSFGPIGVMGGFYLCVMIFSQFISNTATAVLFAPIAITSAIQLGVSPYPFLIAVSVAASMAFATPVASPPNALVMTAGGYSFMDFFRAGIPLQVVLFIVMMFAIPFFFPL
ncbi:MULTISPECIES: SLC13 family permease [Bacillaceae]|uniref:SLC13 family permease n=1 Tax=Evansella alkalicola TaxID=745819 RepID=A0ABS6JZ83_9BACI|nr:MULTISPECIES: SLC13 family permease [Bacillaceae]MBU9723894.1 SLC13 family permease [Bacillus alkalicola]